MALLRRRRQRRRGHTPKCENRDRVKLQRAPVVAYEHGLVWRLVWVGYFGLRLQWLGGLSEVQKGRNLKWSLGLGLLPICTDH